MERVMKTRTFSGTKRKEITKREIQNREVAERAAAEGMVLLKNEGNVLPLKAGCKVALYGIGASKTIKGGTGSGDVNERERISIYEGMKNAGFQITNEEWIRAYDSVYDEKRKAWRDEILELASGKEASAVGFFSVYTSHPFVLPSGGPAWPTQADTAVYVLSRIAGEGADRFAEKGDYYLTDEEHQLLKDICRYYEHVIVAVNAGGLVDLSFLDEFSNIQGLLMIVQPGMEGGNAFADVVSGRVTPSGKLTDSWAYRYEDYPNAENFSHNNGNVVTETYNEGIYVGYRYFDSFQIPVRYSFGYGLSYTTFSMEMQELSTERTENGPKVRLRVRVCNQGRFRGKEVVQIYASCPAGRLEKEYRRLAAFEKTRELKPGESQELELCILPKLLASYDEERPGWVLEPGYYGIWAGNSLAEAKLEGAVFLDREALLVKTEPICPLQQELEEFHLEKETREKREQTWTTQVKEKNLPVVSVKAEDIPAEKIEYKKNAELADPETKAFADSLSVEELIRLSAGDPGKAQGGNLGAAGISVPGSAGETHSFGLRNNLASIVLADGPAGLRLMQYYHVEDGKLVPMPFQFSLEGGIFCPDTEKLPGERYYQYCTAIPVGTLLAQTWNLALLEEVGAIIGGEMELFGITLWLAPGMNIHRNPLCGRNFEYYSEDPLLSGRLAAAMTKGVQSVPGCGTTIKHFACNNQEDNRMDSDSVVSERALREIYLKGFEIAVKTSRPMAMMTSYNRINGVHAANNYDICTKAARNEWGFDGLIMTDWTTTEKDESCTAAGCMRAGNDLVMPGCAEDHENLKKELEEGTLDTEDLKACISRTIGVILRSNQYE